MCTHTLVYVAALVRIGHHTPSTGVKRINSALKPGAITRLLLVRLPPQTRPVEIEVDVESAI